MRKPESTNQTPKQASSLGEGTSDRGEPLPGMFPMRISRRRFSTRITAKRDACEIPKWAVAVAVGGPPPSSSSCTSVLERERDSTFARPTVPYVVAAP